MKQGGKRRKKGLFIALGVTVALLVGAVVAGVLTNGFGWVTPLLGLVKATKKTVESESMTVTVSLKREVVWGSEGYTADGRFLRTDEGPTLLGTLEGKPMALTGEKVYWLNGGQSYIADLPNTDDSAVNWEGVLRLFGLENDVDTEKLKDFALDVYRQYLCDDVWLAEKLGFEQNETVYRFRPKAEEAVTSLFDMAVQHELFSRDLQTQIEEKLDAVSWELVEQPCLTFTVEDGWLRRMELTATVERNALTLTVSFDDLGTTTIGDAELGAVATAVEAAIEQDTCPTCGTRLWGSETCGACK